MLLTRTSEYALQALIHLAAQREGHLVLNRDIARYLAVPAPYLAKILKQLAKAGLVVSSRGRGGGYALHPLAREVSIRDVVEVVEGPAVFEGCLLGLKVCSEATACPVHHAWAPLKATVLGLLEQRSIGAMAGEVQLGRYRLVPPASATRRRSASPGGRRGPPKGT